ncbi:hypothetical protein ATKI12_8161, partial [Kitasatospora sp. Ki12]
MVSPWVRQVKTAPSASGLWRRAWSMSVFQTGQSPMPVCRAQTVSRGASMTVDRRAMTGA